ncbi:hypothetical protein C0J52_15696, partial [Blattella germanica]
RVLLSLVCPAIIQRGWNFLRPTTAAVHSDNNKRNKRSIVIHIPQPSAKSFIQVTIATQMGLKWSKEGETTNEKHHHMSRRKG